ncbi:hypothetical protein KFZ70_06815 [Tamlana fucoidanivorans]|uniref:Uncharacterized protein n=1 Tax=Allotamlana fucoidanivorans TaxID=2583814 RepID=A0A5C4SNA3_9FLAO|nr:hypothetical protein [Tamlana fucoidanivorans]TNJ45278.1 hypothetical protein FGF67_06090 [Tamlana fucoidanivorans]
MKHLLLLILLFSVYTASAQISFRTGSVTLDADLNIVNTQGRSNLNAFYSDMRLFYNISENKLNYMGATLNMVPGEIFLSLEISRVARVSIDRVLTVYKGHKSQGWGAIAKQLGIKPGSAEFHELKKGTGKKTNRGQGRKQKKDKHKGKH